MRWFAIAAALSLGVAACGSDGEETAATEVNSPISEFLGFDDSGNPEANEARFIEEERARQEVIAECMREQGFEYSPVDPDQFVSFEEPGGLEWGSDEWVAKYGFGISTQRWSQDEVGPDLVGHEYDDQGEQFEDPNQDYVESLSDSEREAYYAALSGDPENFPAIDETLSEEEIEAQTEGFEWEPSGCEGEAYDETGSGTANEFYQEYGDELDTMYERMQNDPRIVEAEQALSDCVADKGYDYTDMESVYETFEADLAEVDSGVTYPGQDLTEDDYSSMSEAELQDLFSEGVTFSDEALAKLAEIQEQEIAMAVAVNECGGGFQNLQELFGEVVAEYEQEFLDEHEGELDEFRAEA
jgi:hypothetical protein